MRPSSPALDRLPRSSSTQIPPGTGRGRPRSTTNSPSLLLYPKEAYPGAWDVFSVWPETLVESMSTTALFLCLRVCVSVCLAQNTTVATTANICVGGKLGG